MSGGRDSYAWQQMRESARKTWAASGEPCALCGGQIDYSDRSRSNPMRLHVDHIVPFKHRPDLELELSNLQPAHMRCNIAKGDGRITVKNARLKEGVHIKK